MISVVNRSFDDKKGNDHLPLTRQYKLPRQRTTKKADYYAAIRRPVADPAVLPDRHDPSNDSSIVPSCGALMAGQIFFGVIVGDVIFRVVIAVGAPGSSW